MTDDDIIRIRDAHLTGQGDAFGMDCIGFARAIEREAQREREPQFPEGKLNADDEGALTFAIGAQDGRVVFRFPKPVAWIACPPEQALDIAEKLIAHATALGVKRPVTITLGRK